MKAFLHKNALLLLLILLLVAAISLGLFLSYYHNSPKHPFQGYSAEHTKSVTIEYISCNQVYKDTLTAQEAAALAPYLQDIVIYSKNAEDFYDYNGGYVFVLQITDLDGESVEIELLSGERLYINDVLYHSDAASINALNDYLLHIIQARTSS